MSGKDLVEQILVFDVTANILSREITKGEPAMGGVNQQYGRLYVTIYSKVNPFKNTALLDDYVACNDSLKYGVRMIQECISPSSEPYMFYFRIENGLLKKAKYTYGKNGAASLVLPITPDDNPSSFQREAEQCSGQIGLRYKPKGQEDSECIAYFCPLGYKPVGGQCIQI